MENLSKEQLVDFLEKLQDYGNWMYASKEGKENFEKRIIDIEGNKISLKVLDNGCIKMILNGGEAECVYQVMSHCSPPKQGIDCIDYKVGIMQPETFDQKYKDFFDKNAIFIISLFQRLNAFCFFSRMAPETINQFAYALSKLGPRKY